jgi:hypothetical protein
VIGEEAENVLKRKDRTIEVQRMWNVQNKGDTSNNRGNSDHLKIIQKVRDQCIWKALHQQITKKNSHVCHCANTSESTTVNVQDFYHGK